MTRKLYHGTISDFMERIKSHGKLYSWLNSQQVPVVKVSGGYPNEGGLIWLSADMSAARFYASGGEVDTAKGLVADFGGVFEVEIDESLKLAPLNKPLTAGEADILNKHIPHYKQVKAGDALSIAVNHRSNGRLLWKDALRMIGYDGIVEKNSRGVDVQIAIIADSIDVNIYYDKDGNVNALHENTFFGNAGAGCIFLARDTKRILLPFRSLDVNEPHTWGTWGGKIDNDESPEDAVRREISEEAAYVGKYSLIPCSVFTSGTFKYYNYIAVVNSEFDPVLNGETDDFEWVTLDELPSPLHFGLRWFLKKDNRKIKSIIDRL
jgi:8-oxo-dGTP pyrophosphatase MutT (NUDIX family)